ncbi:S1C family serine protease [Sphaerobacter thermophilus]|uniref:Peptidase S1 and S6 chymotrypsin/Hap n=1 Tax=Sphaerobacter thermophilus (strain ATCC 49802 / DSM 20745 / KCCM 41009 / NCIMB 13125 / S 6022) TaxID=479434 RepID=D1C9X3_SPHTD|nr:trypsin-like peptidase domain-containing protein [Sphaerobacter thermophilus]ACZ40616.1 peptidase S1 and S6 chymotrypsin/Hap [Sphaerobacter thermophilus DSM 20745]
MTGLSTQGRLAPLGAAVTAVAERLRPSVVTIENGSGGAGAGVIWSDDGLIITNDHVVPGERARVRLGSQDVVLARVVGRDRLNDLAALRVPREGLAPAEVGDSRTLRPGQIVLAMGHPMGLSHALTLGIVSALPSDDDERELIRADLALAPGNSGGPMVDAAGRVVGINAMVASPGVALAVPSHVVADFVEHIGEPTPWLGITALPVVLPPALRRRVGVAAGLMITAVERGGPAETAGLLPGDVIVAIAEEPVRHPRHLLEALARTPAGGDLDLVILRGGQGHRLRVAPAHRAPQADAPPARSAA